MFLNIIFHKYQNKMYLSSSQMFNVFLNLKTFKKCWLFTSNTFIFVDILRKVICCFLKKGPVTFVALSEPYVAGLKAKMSLWSLKDSDLWPITFTDGNSRSKTRV